MNTTGPTQSAPGESPFAVFAAPECGADQTAARRIARAFDERLRNDGAARRRERLTGLGLALEWLVIVGLTYVMVFAMRPLAVKLLLLIPWSLYSSLALDNITHYANHWPLFRSRLGNALWRASGVLVFFNPLEIRAIHQEHHRAYARADNDERVFAASDRGRSFWGYLTTGALDGLKLLWPLRPMDPCVQALRQRQPAHYREVMAVRFAMLLWFIFLLVLDPINTLCFLVPAVLMVGSLGSLVMNLTDHIPGDSHHPFRLATFLEPTTPAERFFSQVNHYTAATHLTHHLFPAVHWMHLPRLQRQLADIYVRHGAPRSLLINSTLLGNPFAFVRLARELDRRRFEIGSPLPPRP